MPAPGTVNQRREGGCPGWTGAPMTLAMSGCSVTYGTATPVTSA
ncbi:hypothetical protein [Streptomyces flavofungini]